MLRKSFTYCVVLTFFLLSACDSAPPPELMKASKQFKSDEIRDNHIAYMRKNHMDALKHKRDETVYNGIRTEHHSLNACINCHVPESYNGKILRHTDPEHFCSTCHNYVATELNCFECHVDHPVSENMSDNEMKTHSDFALQGLPNPTNIKNEKVHKSGGVYFYSAQQPYKLRLTGLPFLASKTVSKQSEIILEKTAGASNE